MSDELLREVAEALPRDAGRGIVRLDPEDMLALGIEVGQAVGLRGSRLTTARAMPTYPEDRGKGSVQMDGVVRENAGIAIGQRVGVVAVTCNSAHAIVLEPAGAGWQLPPEQQSALLQRLLENSVTSSGDRLQATLLGSRRQQFTVVETRPSGVVRVTTATTIRLQQPRGQATPDRVSYEDVGGLGQQLGRVRELIELPLRHPELFQRLGIDPPKGILMYGPPGSGKTLIARAVASESKAHFLQISGPEIIHKFYGESESHLRKIFEEARQHAPAIIFVDEIDAIAPRRTEVQGEVEKRVVAQLLALMDGLQSRGDVIIIGATNLPDALDPALRRPGRFDRELEIPVPDVAGRREILQIHSRGMPLQDVDLDELARQTHGYVGADLAALCREAAMAALHRALPLVATGDPDLDSEDLERLQVMMDDFRAALREVEPAGGRDVFVELPAVGWAQVGGLEQVKQELEEALVWPLRFGALLRQAGVRPPRGILLYGPPGTGKTLLARALARESGVNFIPVKGPALLSKYVGESERAVREIFRKARQMSPCLLFLDEVDSLAPARGSGADNAVADRLVGQLLTEIDGVQNLTGVVVLAATNRKDRLDPALLRPGRFDIQLALPLPDASARTAIFAVHTRELPLAAGVSCEDLAAASEGCSGAMIEAICRRAALLAVREVVARWPAEAEAHAGEVRVGRQHFTAALAEQNL